MEPRVLKPMFDHGQVNVPSFVEICSYDPLFSVQLGLIPFSARDDESIISSIKRSDLVVNFIGKNYETKHLVPTRRSNGKLCRVNFDFEGIGIIFLCHALNWLILHLKICRGECDDSQKTCKAVETSWCENIYPRVGSISRYFRS